MGDDDRRRQAGGDGVHRVPSPWGEVVIPDDLSELADEAAKVRRELRAARRKRRLLRLLGGRAHSGRPSATGPLLVVLLTMVVALVSLFGGFWPVQPREADVSPPVRGVGAQLPALTLIDDSGEPVELHRIRPAVILSVEQCPCDRLIADAARVAASVKVPLVVLASPHARNLPTEVEGPDPNAVRSLADPDHRFHRAVLGDRELRRDTGLAVLVGTDGSIAQIYPDVRAAEEFSAGIRALR